MTVNVVALTEILETMSFALTLLLTGFQGGKYHDNRCEIPIGFMHCYTVFVVSYCSPVAYTPAGRVLLLPLLSGIITPVVPEQA